MWLFDLIGSLGLFLLGMWLMTEGLKLAGGEALQRLLGRWTSSRLRGLAAGVLVTALVQSSSAITIATIGFVNAGLMAFQQSVWVIFGSNVGTTLTAWLVTLFGFSVDIEAFTFPLFGLGAFLRAFSPYKRGQAMGMALAGFGLLFMGIDALQGTFSGLADTVDFTRFAGSGLSGALLGFFIGFILTVAAQSSSAAIALILTAVASGLVDINISIAAVIGANVGTTSTALISTISATANAKRLAFAHVTFNLITGVVALLLMPVFLLFAPTAIGPENYQSLTVFLAIFHTCFNLMGVVLMVPIEPWLSNRLQKMFEVRKLGEMHRPTLDKNVATVPDLAMRALTIELSELQQMIGKINLDKLVNKERLSVPESVHKERKLLEDLKQRLEGVSQFISLISQADLTDQLSSRLTAGFSASHYLNNSYQTLTDIMEQQKQVAEMDSHVYELLNTWLQEMTIFASDIAHTDKSYRSDHWPEVLASYQLFKQEVLSATINRGIDMDSVETALFIGSLSRRYVEQLIQVSESYDLLSHPNDKIEAEDKVEEIAEESDSAKTEVDDESIEALENAEDVLD
jgi:phosphate:Na+ symporter